MDSLCPTLPATIRRMNIEKRKERTDPFMLDIQIRAATGHAICIPIKCTNPCAVRENLRPGQATHPSGQLSLPHAIRVASAKYWLKLGEADEALRELEGLPKAAWNHPAAAKARVAALAALPD